MINYVLEVARGRDHNEKGNQMNKHTAINEKTGQVFTRNSKARVYAYAVIVDFHLTNGSIDTPWLPTWTSRLDLAQGIKARMDRDYIAACAADATIERFEVQILKAELR
jgi:hypothetical protein